MADKPIIASDVGEVRNMLTDDQGNIAGYLIDISRGKIPVARVAEDLAHLAGNSKGYEDKQAIVKRLRPRFDMNKVASDYGELYHRILAVTGK